jgi:hypothetical protein
MSEPEPSETPVGASDRTGLPDRQSPKKDKIKLFWRRQFAPESTRQQLIFDIVFGLLAPVFCVLMDPIVFFSHAHNVRTFSPYSLYAYILIAIEIVALLLIMINQRKSATLAAILTGPLFVGAAFSIGLGIAILPLSVPGLIFGIGILGFTPFLTALVYLRNGVRSIQAVRFGFKPVTIWITTLVMALLTLAITYVMALEVKYQITNSIITVLSGQEEQVAAARFKLGILYGFNDLELYLNAIPTDRRTSAAYHLLLYGDDRQRKPVVDRFKRLKDVSQYVFLYREYNHGSDADKRQRIERAIKEITGKEKALIY